MIPRTLLFLVLLTLFAAPMAAQVTLQIPISPVKPGVPFTVVLTNNTSGCIDPSVTNVLTLLQPDGQLIKPVLVGCGPVGSCMGKGAKINLSFTAPASGPGSSGSFVLLCPASTGAAVRLNVGTMSSHFPDLHAYPAGMPNGPGAHHIATPATTTTWRFANTASVARTLSPTIGIYRPGAATPIRSFVQPVFTVPANGITGISLPLTGLAAGPYTIEARWADPGTQTTVTMRHGIELSSGVMVDLHLPGGPYLLRGTPLPVRIAVTQPSYRAPTPWPYVVAIGYQPGTTRLGTAIVPLAMDPLVVASVMNGVGGLLTANVGTTSSTGVYCAHSVTYFPTATGIRFTHPGPLTSGVRLRVGAIAIDPATKAIVASQPEEIILQ